MRKWAIASSECSIEVGPGIILVGSETRPMIGLPTAFLQNETR